MQNFDTALESEFADELYNKDIIGIDERTKVESDTRSRNFSLSTEASAFMSVGAILLTSGLGILIYKNIDRIGHLALIACMSAVTLFGLLYCYRKANTFSFSKTDSPGVGFDYILLISNIMMLTLLQYLNSQTDVFGNTGAHYLLGGLFVLFNAYYFDHAGVLSVGISSVATFFGVKLNAFGLFETSITAVALTASIFSVFLEGTGVVLESKRIKPHFRFTFVQFSIHLFFMSLITLISDADFWFIVPLLAAIGVLWYKRYSEKEKSFYLLFFTFIYAYIILTILMVRIIDKAGIYSDLIGYLFLIYLIASAIFSIGFMKRLHKKLKGDL